MPLRALLLQLRDQGSPRDSPLCGLLTALLQRLAPRPDFPTVLCSAFGSQLGAAFVGSALRDCLQDQQQLQLNVSLSILEGAADEAFVSAGEKTLPLTDSDAQPAFLAVLSPQASTFGADVRQTLRPFSRAARDWLAQQLQQLQAADAVAALPATQLHRLIAALAADPETFAPQLERLAATCPPVQASAADPSLLALLPQPAAGSAGATSQKQQQQQQLASGAVRAADIASSMAGHGGSGSGGGLAPLLEQLGYAATASDTAARKVVSHAGELSPQAVAAALGLMARTREGLAPRREDAPAALASALGGLSLDGSPSWQPEALVDAIKAHAPDLDWSVVAASLDQPDFSVPDAAALQLLAAAFRRAGRDGFPLPAALGRVWQNPDGQLSLLRAAAGAPPEVASFAGLNGANGRRQPPVEGLAGGAPANGTPNEAWLSLDLLETLARLSTEGGNHAGVRAVLEAGAQAAPEVLLLGFVQARADWGVLGREVRVFLSVRSLLNM